MTPRGKLVLKEQAAGESAAYLSMWKALESFDPQADRWAEPVSLGSREVRIKAAEVNVSRLEKPGKKTKRDIERFQTLLKKLQEGSRFDAATAAFSKHLRDRGCALARESVAVAGRATS